MSARLRVVMVAYQSDADLRRCLPGLRDEPGIETVIVDNASLASTKTLVETEFPWARYLDAGANLGFARGNNLGAEGFNGEYLCFLNPDTELDPGALGQLADFLDARGRAGAAGPYVRNTDGSRQMSYRRWPGLLTPLFHRYSLLTRLWPGNPGSRRYLLSDDDGAQARQVDWIAGCCLLVRRSAFEAIGGFDRRYFMFCEDTALCKRLALEGWERWHVPGAAITHHLGKSASERSVRLVFQRHRSMWIYFTTFEPRWPLYAPFVLAGLALRFSVYALRALCARAR